MFRISGLTIFLAALVFASASVAANVTVVGSVGDSVSPSSTSVRGHNWNTGNTLVTINVTCYYAETGNQSCAGGGIFDSPAVAPSCSDADNGATILQDSVGHCFYRRNFTLNGVVDARQCGVVGDGNPAGGTLPGGETHPDDAQRLNICLTLASKGSASPYEVPIVNTGGGVILDNTTTITIPPNTELTCGGNTVPDRANSDYRIFDKHGNLQLASAIVIDPQYTIAMPGAGSGSNAPSASFTGCILEAGAGATVSNPNSPSVWFPGCNPSNLTTCNDDNGGDPYLRSAIVEAHAFFHDPTASSCPATGDGPAGCSVGITLDAADGRVRDVTVLGFGTCLADGGVRTDIDNLVGDCNTGISIVGSNNPRIGGFNITPVLTGGPFSLVNVISNISAPTGGEYNVTAAVDPASFPFVNGDTVWIATADAASTDGGGTESARGRWQIHNLGSTSCGMSFMCPTFDLLGSQSAATTTGGTIRTDASGGIPPTAITGITTSTMKFITPGQAVSDPSPGLNCISGAKVTAVWPATGTVYISPAPTCAGSDTIKFQDNAYTPNTTYTCNQTNTSGGCVIIDQAFRYGDALYANNVGGISAVHCEIFEHQIGWHMDTGANGSRWTNCAIGDNFPLPQRNIWDVHNSIISVLIEGEHGTYVPDATMDDACDNMWTNAILGQHRPVGIVVQSNCPASDRFENVGLGVDNDRNSGIAVEVDAGGVILSNAYGGGGANIFKGEKTQYGTGDPTIASLNISNNLLSGMTVYTANTNAALSTWGCGNVFAVTTPYLCAPSSFVQPPGGRLALPAGTNADCTAATPPSVMTSDAVGAKCVFYVPYTGQQVPLYSPEAATFGLVDVGSKLSLPLDSSVQLAGSLYDIFFEDRTGVPELCTGPAWQTGNTVRTIDVQQIDGIWVNAAKVSNCHYGNGTGLDRSCAAFACTYLGTIYMTANGQTTQQFKPAAASGGSLNCVCLYNAYNRVTITSESFDSEGQYTYPTNTWRPMGNTMGARNTITVVDGLGQMYVSAQLNDLMFKTPSTGGTGAIGIDLNSTTLAPALVAQVATTTQASYQTMLTNPPVKGLWYVQAMEKAVSGLSVTFGGATFQELSVQVQD